MLGYAAQKGLLPVTLASLEQAIRLNGTFIDGNLRTLALGRLAAHDPEALPRELAPKKQGVGPLGTVDDVLASRMRLLPDYQVARYAAQYKGLLADVSGRPAAQSRAAGGRLCRDVAPRSG